MITILPEVAYKLIAKCRLEWRKNIGAVIDETIEEEKEIGIREDRFSYTAATSPCLKLNSKLRSRKITHNL